MMTFTKATLALAILAAAGNAAAQHVSENPPPVMVVTYADLNVGSAAGLHVLQARVHAAASRLCVQVGLKPLEQQMAERRCMSAAISSAQAGIEQAIAQSAVHMAFQSGTQVTAR
jgi:UrcA family protein